MRTDRKSIPLPVVLIKLYRRFLESRCFIQAMPKAYVDYLPMPFINDLKQEQPSRLDPNHRDEHHSQDPKVI